MEEVELMTKIHQRKDKLVYLFSLKDVQSEQNDVGTIKERTYIKWSDDDKPKRFWAHYKALSGGEKVKYEADFAENDAEFYLNWCGEVFVGMYIEDITSKRIYKIKFIDDFEGNKNTDLKILATQEYGIGC